MTSKTTTITATTIATTTAARPPKRALIVIDVQKEYFTGNLRIEYPDPQQSLANIGRAMDAAHAAGIPVIVVQNFAPATAPVFARGSALADLREEIASRPRSHYVEKQLPSAFLGTDLADYLGAQGIDTLTVTGYMTHNCDDTTVKHALDRGLNVEFLSDASGSVPYSNRAGSATAEEIHRVFTVVMQSRFAAVLSTDEWLQSLTSGEPPVRENIYSSNQAAIAKKQTA